MATPNYSYEKRQRELAKKRKKEEKAMRKTSGGHDQSEASPEGDTQGGDAPAPGDTGAMPPAAP